MNKGWESQPQNKSRFKRADTAATSLTVKKLNVKYTPNVLPEMTNGISRLSYVASALIVFQMRVCQFCKSVPCRSLAFQAIIFAALHSGYPWTIAALGSSPVAIVQLSRWPSTTPTKSWQTPVLLGVLGISGTAISISTGPSLVKVRPFHTRRRSFASGPNVLLIKKNGRFDRLAKKNSNASHETKTVFKDALIDSYIETAPELKADIICICGAEKDK